MELLKSPLFNSANLVGYYRMEGNGNTSKGSVNGTPSNVTFNAGNGKFGQGAGFNGSNSQINLGNNFNYGKNNAFSLTLWVYPTSTGYRNFINKQTGSGSFRGYGFETLPNYIPSFFLRRGGGTNNNFSRNTVDPIPSNEWTFLVATYAGNNNRSGITLYVNGKPVAMQDGGEGATISSGDITDGGASFGIGRRIEGGGSPFGGRIDDVGVWNRVLTASEIKKLYQKTSGAFLSLI